MIYVHLDSPTNSTMFTNCCGCAITDRETKCPKCKQEVYPGEGYSEHQASRARWEHAYGPFRLKGRRT